MVVDIMRYQGQNTKETRAFKSQMRFDYEMFVNAMTILFRDIARGIRKDIADMQPYETTFEHMATRFDQGAELIVKTVQRITENRLREKGYGIYVDKDGKVYSIFEDENELKNKVEEDIKFMYEQEQQKTGDTNTDASASSDTGAERVA